MAIADEHHECAEQRMGPDTLPPQARGHYAPFDHPLRFGDRWFFMVMGEAEEFAVPIRFCPWCGARLV